jgi:hypothetical protein
MIGNSLVIAIEGILDEEHNLLKMLCYILVGASRVWVTHLLSRQN